MNPYFSILIPVFNRFGKMDSCVSSVMEQTFGDFEAILVNDGSTDGSLAMLNEYASKDSRFRVVSHERNQSALAARFTGMREATGKVILFLDSDDFIEKNTLMEIHGKYEETRADIIRFGMVTEQWRHSWLLSPCDDLLGGLLDGVLHPGVCSKAYAERVIKAALRTGESFYCNMGEDLYMSTVFLANAETHADIDRIFYHYMFGAGQSALFKNNDIEKVRKQFDSAMAAGEHMASYLEKHKPHYAGKVNRALMRLLDCVLRTNLAWEEDPVNAVRCVALFDREDTRELFRCACRDYLRRKYVGGDGDCTPFAEEFATESEYRVGS